MLESTITLLYLSIFQSSKLWSEETYQSAFIKITDHFIMQANLSIEL